MLLKENVCREINALIWFHYKKKDEDQPERVHSCQNPKSHKCKMVVVLLHLASSLATVVRQASRRNLSFGDFVKKYISSFHKCFLGLMLYLMLDGLILFCKSDFHCVKCLYDDF